MFFVGRGWGGHLFTFWAFRVGTYSRWALIRRWAVNRINTVIENVSGRENIRDVFLFGQNFSEVREDG